MTNLAEAVARSGALDGDMLREFNKWKLPITVPEEALYSSPEEAVAAIEEAIESANQVEVRVTDVDILRQYLQTQRKGRLKLVAEEETGSFDISYGMSRSGEYIIPWRTDSLSELMTNGKSYMVDEQKRKVYFAHVQDLYFGESKAFILCAPTRDTHGTQDKG